jgi:hypothetical protein
MWRLALLALIPALAVTLAPTASAAADVVARTPGAQSFQIWNGHGRAVVLRKRGGSVILVVRHGRLRVVDLPGGAGELRTRCNRTGERVSQTTVEYRGPDVRCLVFGGTPWQAVARGHRISGSGVVRGSLTLDAFDEGPAGRFQIADRPVRRWPRVVRTYSLVAQ